MNSPRRHATRSFAALLLAVLGASSWIQGQSVPARDRTLGTSGPTTPTTGVIRGRVVAADTALPLRGAEVRVNASAVAKPWFAVTDAEGRFSLELSSGTYAVSASKTGYARTSFGQRSARDTPSNVRLEAAAEVVVDLALPRAGVIVARIINEDGEPLDGFRVTALERRFLGGRARFTNVTNPFGFTDDRGELRLYGLPPGDYYVSARPGQLEPFSRPLTEVETFYPGTLVPGPSSRIQVAPGSETVVTFPVLRARLAKVSGVVLDSIGAPVADGTVDLSHVTTTGIAGRQLNRSPSGAFVADDLTPGEYLLRVRTGRRAAGVEYAAHRLTLSGADVEGIQIQTRPGARVGGRVTFDEPAATWPQPSALKLRVEPAPTGMTMSPGIARINDDWSFELSDLMAEGVLRIEGEGWQVRNVVMDGRDVTDVAVDFHALQAVRDMQVVLTRRLAQISGAAVSERAGEVLRFIVVVFPSNPELWTHHSRFIVVGRSDQTGRFVVSGLPAGDYQVTAVENLDQGAERDPETLKLLLPVSTRLTLRAGESRSLDLRMSKPR